MLPIQHMDQLEEMANAGDKAHRPSRPLRRLFLWSNVAIILLFLTLYFT